MTRRRSIVRQSSDRSSLAQVKAEIADFYQNIRTVNLDDEPELDTMGALLSAREDVQRGIEIRDADARHRAERS